MYAATSGPHVEYLDQTPRHPLSRLMAPFSQQPGLAGTTKVKPIWILMNQEMTRWQWHQLDQTQIICTSLKTDNHASISSLNVLTSWMLFLTSNQCQRTEGTYSGQTDNQLLQFMVNNRKKEPKTEFFNCGTAMSH